MASTCSPGERWVLETAARLSAPNIEVIPELEAAEGSHPSLKGEIIYVQSTRDGIGDGPDGCALGVWVCSANRAFHTLPRDEEGRVAVPAENVTAVGKSLFTDYLVPVELAGMLLLVATIGAIAISSRRTGGLR